MKYKLITMLLAFALLLTMAGCSAAGAGRALDRAGERVENGLDAIEDTVENAARRAAPNPAVADPQNTTTATEAAPAATEHASASSETSSADTITKAQAENIALKHVGFTADQVSRLHTEYEIDNGIPQYDVEFHKDNIEYEFEIHAQTGEILSFDKDHEND